MLIVNHGSMELEKENSYSFRAAVLSTLTASLAVSDPLESSWVWALKWTRTTSASSNLHHPYFIPTPSLPTPSSQQGALGSFSLPVHSSSKQSSWWEVKESESTGNEISQGQTNHVCNPCSPWMKWGAREPKPSPYVPSPIYALGFGKWMFLPQFSGSSLLRGYFYEDSLFTLFAGKQKAVTMWMVPVSVNSFTIRKLVSFL